MLLILSLFLLSGCSTKAETCAGMHYSKAVELAKTGECGVAELKETHSCNEITQTWWIDLDLEKENCNPACVINAETEEVKINWRCTGALEGATGKVIKFSGGVGDSLDL